MRLMTQHLPRLTAIALAAMLGSAHAAIDVGPSISGDAATVNADGTAVLQLTVLASAVPKLAAVDLVLSGWWPGLQFNPDASSVLLSSPAMPVLWSALEQYAVSIMSTDTSYALTLWLPEPYLVDLPAGDYGLNLAFNWTGEPEIEPIVHPVNVTLDLTYFVDGPEPSFVTLPTGEFSTSITVSAVPEPTPTALLLGGLAMLGWLAKRRAA